MLVKGKDVIGLNVVTIDTGTIIETVKDLGYNPTTHTIETLFVKKGSLFSAPKAIHISDVINIGPDAVIVSDASAVQSVKIIGNTTLALSNSKKYLVQTAVLTAEGKNLGKVTDVYFDSESGVVSTMEVSQGGFKTLTEGKKSVTPADVVTIGADTTIVSSYTEQVLEAQGEQAGLKGALNDSKAKVAEIADDVNASLSQSARDVNDSISESVDTIARKGNKVVKRTTKKYEDAVDAVEVETTKVIKKK